MSSELLRSLQDENIYPAHIRQTDSETVIQTVQVHCSEAAGYASDALDDVGLGAAAHLAGLLHDQGKKTDAFRKYLVDLTEGRPVRRGSVNHTFAGVRLALDRLCTEITDPMARIAAEHIAYAVGAHHGLFDAVDFAGEHGFDRRREKQDTTVDEGVVGALKDIDLPELRSRLRVAAQEIVQIYGRFPDMKDRSFFSHLVSRLVLSAVIEGDRRSTAEFLRPDRPQPVRATQQLWEECLNHLEEQLAQFPKNTPVQQGRAEFSARCKAFAQKPSGIYRLNMPTGAGKTLSSLRYALAHANCWDKTHIYFVMPLLAIIDQNAQVIRNGLGRDDILLEHHSNVLPADEENELDLRELLAENWDAPVVITTLVQLLNTMFSHKTASVRRFHNLCNSVIVLDEVQTVPSHMLSLFNQTISFLAEVCGATVILCSATQPALEYAQRPIMQPVLDIVPYEEELWKLFRRTQIKPAPAMSLEELADFAITLMTHKDSLLIVCNKKAQAAKLYELLCGQVAYCFHISASMCMAHRRSVLADMEEAKLYGRVLCVSTQIMEAGIDVSFDCVIRLQAGMDSVIQAAGRCNRHGESEMPLPVYVIRCKGENLCRLKEIQAGRNATAELLSGKMEDFASAEAVEAYYRIFYRDQAVGSQDFYCDSLRTSLYDLLSKNEAYLRGSSYFLNQAYKTAGLHFRVFDDDTVDVVVPYGEGAEALRWLEDAPGDLGRCLEQLKPYSISLYSYQRQLLDEMGALTTAPGGILVLDQNWYDDTLGLVLRQEMIFLEV